MRVFSKYDIGKIAFSSGEKSTDYLIPKQVVTNPRHPVFEYGYYWLCFYFYKRRVCTKCGATSCRMGLIPYYNNISTKEKVIAWFCPSCGKPIKEIRQKARKKCNYCSYLNRNCDGGSGCLKNNVIQ